MTGFIGILNRVRDYTERFTITPKLVSTVKSSLPLLGSGLQRRTFPFLFVPKLSPASATSFSQQQLTTTELQQPSN
jgi:hypothetical protein